MLSFVRRLAPTVRALRRRPGFSLAVLLTLTLALAANATILALVDAVLLEPLPFAAPERLVALWDWQPETEGTKKDRVSGTHFLQWRERRDLFEGMALYGGASASLTGVEEPVQLAGTTVTEDYFALLGVEAALGRTFAADDFRDGAAPAVVLSHDLWSRRFGADPDLVGHTILLDDDAYLVVGVLPRQILPVTAWESGRLEASAGERFWIPIARIPTRNSHVYGVLARLAEGVDVGTARQRMDELSRVLEAEFPDSNAGYRVQILPLAEEIVGHVERSLWMILGAVALVWLVACANVANLHVARALGRSHELAIRSALGAGRLQITRELLGEGALLGLCGGGLGALAAAAALRTVQALSPEGAVPRLDEAALNPRVLAATLALALLSGLAAAGVSAWQGARRPLENALREGTRGAGSISGRPRMRRGLVAAEMALAVMLVIAASLLIRSFAHLQAVDLGFAQRRVLTFDLAQHPAHYPEMSDLNGFYDRLFASLRAIPGVVSVAAAYDPPLESNWSQGFEIVGDAPPPPGEDRSALFRTVTPDYFSALGIELLQGRAFTEGDDAAAPGVAIVNQSFVRRHLAGRPPLGQRLSLMTTQWQWGDDAIPAEFEIVGVAEDVRFAGPDQPSEPAFYLPYRQTPHHQMTVLVQTRRPPRSVLGQVRQALREIDPALPIAKVATMDEILSTAVSTPRFSTVCLGAFAAAALVLAMVGVWGVLSSSVRERRYEIGVRLALGSSRAGIFARMLRLGLAPALLGAAAGVGGALALARVLQGLLFEVEATDPATYAAVTFALLAVSALACTLPARRAALVDPMTVLRDE